MRSLRGTQSGRYGCRRASREAVRDERCSTVCPGCRRRVYARIAGTRCQPRTFDRVCGHRHRNLRDVQYEGLPADGERPWDGHLDGRRLALELRQEQCRRVPARSRWWVSSSSAGEIAPVSSWNRRTLNHSKGTSAVIGSGGVLHLWAGEVGEALAGKQRRWGPPVPCVAHSWRSNSTSVCVRARRRTCGDGFPQPDRGHPSGSDPPQGASGGRRCVGGSA